LTEVFPWLRDNCYFCIYHTIRVRLAMSGTAVFYAATKQYLHTG